MSGGLMLDKIIMNIFSETAEQEINSVVNNLFSKIKNDEIYLYQKSLQGYTWKKITDAKKTLRSHHFMKKMKLWKYLGGLLSIIFDEEDLKNITKQWINDMSIFNNEHIIQRYNILQSNIPEEPRHISCMTPTRFVNSQNESRRYVNSSFQVFFFSIFFRQLVINIDC